MRDTVIVTAIRTPGGKAFRGAYRTMRPDALAVAAVRGALERTPGLDPAEIDEVILGCSFPEAEQGMNIARNVALAADLPESVPGVTVNRFCSSGLQAIASGAQAIMSGMAEVVVAGGTESMTRIQGPGTRFMPDPNLVAALPVPAPRSRPAARAAGPPLRGRARAGRRPSRKRFSTRRTRGRDRIPRWRRSPL